MSLVLAVAAFLGAACSDGADQAEFSQPGPPPTTAAASAASAAPTVPAAPATPTTTVPPGPPVAADTAAGLAAQLAEAEAAIRSPATPASQLPRLGHTQQVAYAALIRHPEWRNEVLAALPANWRSVAESLSTAGSNLRALASSEPRPLPRWRIVTPPPPAELLAEYRGAEAAIGVPWQFLAAIHLVETRMGRIRGDSTAGAQGPMQFIPTTWAIYGEGDINSNHDAILAAARLLRASGAPSNMDRALFAYNPSNRYVQAVTAYAQQMQADERAYLGFYHWQVYYFETWLPEGWANP